MRRKFIPLFIGLGIIAYMWLCVLLYPKLMKIIYKYTDADEIGGNLLAAFTAIIFWLTLLIFLFFPWKN